MLTKMLSWKLSKWHLFFKIIHLAVHTFLPPMSQYLIPFVKKLLSCWLKSSATEDMTSSSPRYWLSTKYFYVGEQMIVRWDQLRTIERVNNQFIATVTHISHWNQEVVCWSILPTRQVTTRQFSWTFDVDSLSYLPPQVCIVLWIDNVAIWG